MGEHSLPEPPPPPKDKPRYRFVVAIGGIVTLAFIAMAAVAALYPERSPAAAEPDLPNIVANPFPSLPSVDPGVPTGPTPGPTTAAPTTPAPTTTASVATATPTPPRSNPSSSDVTASYVLTNDWGSRFQAKVTLTNPSSSEVGWTLRLSYPSNVTAFAGVWIDGYDPQPIRSDITLPEVTFSGGGPLAPGESITVTVQFDKTDGDVEPSLRTVNGAAF